MFSNANQGSSSTRFAVQRMTAELRASPRLRLGLAAIIAIAIIVGILSLDDARGAAQRKYNALQTENARMRKQLGSTLRQQRLQSHLNTAQARMGSMWLVSSPVIAQTELSDWLISELDDIGVKGVKVEQPTFRHISDRTINASTAKKEEKNGQECDMARCQLIELRTTIRLPYDPNTINKALSRIEGEDRPIRVDQMIFNANERRAELTVQVLAKLSDKASPEGLSGPDQALPPAVEANKSAAAESVAEVQKKVVEVKW